MATRTFSPLGFSCAGNAAAKMRTSQHVVALKTLVIIEYLCFSS
jgi:hypothetical protein